VLVALAACGRIGFAPQGTTSGDGGGDGVIDGVPDRPNVVFVTASPVNGALGGLAGADAACASEASAAGLPGTFVAWLSTSTSDARDRLAGSRGWIRPDNVVAFDTADSLASFQLRAPLDRDPHGNRVSYANRAVWTGTQSPGTRSSNTCADWTSSTAAGWAGDLSAGQDLWTEDISGTACSTLARLYCMEVGHAFPVAPVLPPGARVAFLSRVAPTSQGLAGMDAVCQADANSAGIPGTFLAAVATSTTTIASRFTAGAPWTRVDGTPLGNLVDGSDPFAFVTQFADGSFSNGSTDIFTGATTPTQVAANNEACVDWTSAASNKGVRIGWTAFAVAATFWSHQAINCAFGQSVLCLQQ
jgi:hypothetical protein